MTAAPAASCVPGRAVLPVDPTAWCTAARAVAFPLKSTTMFTVRSSKIAVSDLKAASSTSLLIGQCRVLAFCFTLILAQCLCSYLTELSSSAIFRSRPICSSGFDVSDWPDLHFWHMLDGGNDPTLGPVHLCWRCGDGHGILL